MPQRLADATGEKRIVTQCLLAEECFIVMAVIYLHHDVKLSDLLFFRNDLLVISSLVLSLCPTSPFMVSCDFSINSMFTILYKLKTKLQ